MCHTTVIKCIYFTFYFFYFTITGQIHFSELFGQEKYIPNYISNIKCGDQF